MAKSFLQFVEIKDTGKTKVWEVNNTSNIILGRIGWYSPWRKYVFMPNESTIWDFKCLSEVKSFMFNEMQKRKK
ncbi:hypothetical protein [Flagellimonas nanhaiensis]|uniref:Uncharacterized protein n=1 Tax=Flagellimonas nanhaiensis TaxID=2292706 RepID=A0A371JNU4_9FLAO|nr:hypothetical protein [Allomuricauda nanhaiensis]RDY58902.1 hypothetical protein DX873_14685 [Allomuricauda nanhaiensis]